MLYQVLPDQIQVLYRKHHLQGQDKPYLELLDLHLVLYRKHHLQELDKLYLERLNLFLVHCHKRLTLRSHVQIAPAARMRRPEGMRCP